MDFALASTRMTFLTLFTLDTRKQVLWQTVKTQMKCHLLHCLLYDKKQSLGTLMHHNSEIFTCDSIKHKPDYPIHLGKSIRMKRVKEEERDCRSFAFMSSHTWTGTFLQILENDMLFSL